MKNLKAGDEVSAEDVEERRKLAHAMAAKNGMDGEAAKQASKGGHLAIRWQIISGKILMSISIAHRSSALIMA